MNKNTGDAARKAASRKLILIIGFIVVSFNLRPAITSVGPLIVSIKADLNLTSGTAGFLVALPVLAFALSSSFAPCFGRKAGSERAILLSMILLIAGILIRSSGFISGLFIGTGLIGVGIAVSNVLLPAIIKEKLPTKIPLMMGIYTASLGVFAAVAVGVSVPLAEGLKLGWQKSLGAWVILAILGLIFWLPQVSQLSSKTARPPTLTPVSGSLFRSRLAWQVTVFMGCISFLFYCLIAWLPEIIHSHGFSYNTAGWMASVFQFVAIPVSFVTPIVAGKLKDQKAIVIGVGVLLSLAFVGLMFVSGSAWALLCCVFIIGAAMGVGFSMAMTFFVLRAQNARDVASLSGMAQSFGYLMAAVGPILVGFLFDVSGSWTLPLVALVAVTVLSMLAGFGAGRNAYVLQETEN